MRAMPMRRGTILLGAALALHALSSCAGRRAGGGDERGEATPLAGARQLVLVVTPAWDSVGATLRRFERADASGAWREVGAAVPAVVGRTGLAWGAGLAARAEAGGPVKREGDGRAPAGVFRLGEAFGFAPPDSVRGWLRMPYRHVTADFECVDDTASRHYNRLLHRADASAVDWGSSEKMRTVAQYRFGLVVDHNGGAGSRAAAKGGGSCIFLHIWSRPAAPGARPAGTAGCTAFSEQELVALLRWLDPDARAVLVQLPDEAYRRLRGEWGVP